MAEGSSTSLEEMFARASPLFNIGSGPLPGSDNPAGRSVPTGFNQGFPPTPAGQQQKEAMLRMMQAHGAQRIREAINLAAHHGRLGFDPGKGLEIARGGVPTPIYSLPRFYYGPNPNLPFN